MAFVDDLRDMMPDSATWRQLASRDDYGAPTFETATDSSFDHVRLVRRNKMVRSAAGDLIASTAQMWIAGAPAVSPQDQIELSDGSTPEIISVERFQDETGECHSVVYFR